MKRILKISIIAILSVVVWIAAILYIGPRVELFPDWFFHSVLLIPVFAPLAFGLYLLYSLIVGVKAFKTVPEESERLQLDIARYVTWRSHGSRREPPWGRGASPVGPRVARAALFVTTALCILATHVAPAISSTSEPRNPWKPGASPPVRRRTSKQCFTPSSARRQRKAISAAF
jgi:hypothetical protein